MKATGLPQLKPFPKRDFYPLSSAQQLIWFSSKLNPKLSALYVFTRRITGFIDLDAFGKALQIIVNRHDSLRTVFRLIDDEVYQDVLDEVRVDLPVIDLCFLSKADQDAEIKRLTKEEPEFYLENGPLIRARLVKLRKQTHILFLTIHSIISDWSSLNIVWRVFTATYNALVQGEEASLPTQRLQYPDVVLWKRKLIDEGYLKAQENYWKQQLSGDLAEQNLQTSYSRPIEQNGRRENKSVILDASFTKKLRSLSFRNGATLSSTILAGFKVMLHSYSGLADVIVGAPFAGRHYGAEFSNIVGPLSNMLPLRTDLSGDPTFMALLDRVKKTVFDAYDNQAYPFEMLNTLISHTEFFQVMFNKLPISLSEPRLRGLSIKPGPPGLVKSMLDLSVYIDESVAGVEVLFVYHPDLFEDKTITRMTQYLQTLLEKVVANPEMRLSDLTILSKSALPLTQNKSRGCQVLPISELTSSKLARNLVPPRDELERQLTKVWEKVLGTQPIGVTDNFFDLGGNSRLAVLLFDKIEKSTGKILPIATIFQAPTVEHLAKILRAEEKSPLWSVLIPVQPRGSKPPLFCVEGAYADLVRHLGSQQPLYMLHVVDLYKEQPNARVEDMAARGIEEMKICQPEGPYFLGGACFGGMVAFEMAQQLHAQGQKVALLALFETYAPGSVYTLPGTPLVYRLSQKINYHLNNLSHLGAKDKLNYVGGKIKERYRKTIWRKIWKIVHKFYIDIGRPVPRAFRDPEEAIHQAYGKAILQDPGGYIPQVYPGRVTLFQASEHLSIPWYHYDSKMGWDGLAAGGLENHEIPGHHTSMFEEPHVRVLAEKLRECIDKSQAVESGKQTEPCTAFS